MSASRDGGPPDADAPYTEPIGVEPIGVEPIAFSVADVVCIDVVELVTAYVEGELDPATAAAVERHLADCPLCQTYLRQMEETVRRLGRLPADTISTHARAELARAFAEYSERSGRG